MDRSLTRVHAGTSKRLARNCIRWSFRNRLSLSTGAMYLLRIILNVPLSCKTRKLSIYSKFQMEDFTLFLQKLEYEIRFIIVKLKQKKKRDRQKKFIPFPSDDGSPTDGAPMFPLF